MDPRRIFRNFAIQVFPEHFRPKFSRIIVTANCPLRCQMCTFWGKRWTDPSLKLIKYWISELADFGVTDISLGGGEPFIRKDLTEIVNEIKSYGIRCGITTSGWLTGKVPWPPADYFEISIDGARPETHDKIRGMKGSWEQAVKTVKIAKEKATVSQLNFVLQRDNHMELVDFCKFAKSLGCNISMIPISSHLAAQPAISKKYGKVDVEFLRSLINEAMAVGNVLNTIDFFEIYLSKIGTKNLRQRCLFSYECKCLFPYECILIYINGNVYPCGNFRNPVGKLTEKVRLRDLYESYAPIRKAVRLGKYEPCVSCTYGDFVPHRGLLRTIKYFAQEMARKRG